MSFRFKIDWDRDGDFTTLFDDVTKRVRSRIDAVHLEYGRALATALAPITAGQGAFTLDNRSKDYSPRNSLSPIYGKMKPARPVLITRTNGANEYTLFRGHTDDQPINPNLDNKTVQLSLVDALADLRGQTITTGVYQGIRTGEAISAVLDACGWSALDRDIDPGATIIPFWWVENGDALQAIEEIVQSEGPPALVTMSPTNKIVYKDRHHRLHDAKSLVSQATFRGSPNRVLPYLSTPFTYDEAWSHIINSAINNIDVRQPQTLAPVFTSELKISLSANQSTLISVASDSPFINAVVPVAVTDYQLISGSVTVSLFRDSGQSTTIKLQAGGSGCVVENIQLRAQPITVVSTIQVSALDQASVNDFGPRSFPTELPWCSPADAEAVLQVAVALRAQPLPIVHASFVCSKIYPAIVDKILSLGLSDRVTLYEDDTALSATDFFIESIEHDFTDELDHRVTFGLEMVANQDISPVFRFDVAGAGFNDGKFHDAIDDPATAFQFSAVGDGGGTGAAGIVQTITGQTASGTGLVTSNITTNAANTLMIIVGRDGSKFFGEITGVTDPVGNTWQLATRGGRSTGLANRCEVWYTSQNAGALAAQAVTFTSGTSMATSYTLVEVSGLNKSDLVEAVSPDYSGEATDDHHQTPDVPQANTRALILAVINNPATTTTFTSLGGVMLSTIYNSPPNMQTSAGYYTAASPGNFHGNFTFDHEHSCGFLTVAFNIAITGGSGIGFGHRFDEGIFVH